MCFCYGFHSFLPNQVLLLASSFCSLFLFYWQCYQLNSMHIYIEKLKKYSGYNAFIFLKKMYKTKKCKPKQVRKITDLFDRNSNGPPNGKQVTNHTVIKNVYNVPITRTAPPCCSSTLYFVFHVRCDWCSSKLEKRVSSRCFGFGTSSCSTWTKHFFMNVPQTAFNCAFSAALALSRKTVFYIFSKWVKEITLVPNTTRSTLLPMPSGSLLTIVCQYYVDWYGTNICRSDGFCKVL